MKKTSALIGSALLASASLVNLPAHAAVGVDSSALRKAVGIDGLMSHLQSLQNIATAFGDREASGNGYAASYGYVKSMLEAAGYAVKVMPFEYPYFEDLAPPTLALTAPTSQTFVAETDFATMSYSGSGNVTAEVQNVGGFVLPPTAEPSSESGCTAAHFAGFVPGRVALIQRGGCNFVDKAANALAAGASAVIIFNEGNPERTDLFGGTLGGQVSPTLPVFSASFEVGTALAALNGPTVSLSASTKVETRTSYNVVAETAGGRTDRVVVVGAHLDGVPGGPAINDNGSGSATVLEVALQMKRLKINPVNKVRFMWYGAEESGLLGSEAYVASLTATQKKHTSMMLNFDMVASPNYVRFVYDGDGSDTPDAGPNGSATIEQVFNKYFIAQKLPFAPTAFDGRSDYGPFIEAGIPAGGLFTGADDVKTPAEQAIYGGIAGETHDQCYHQPCDDITNINKQVFAEMADAAADAILQFAMTTSAVKGTSKANDRAVKLVPGDSLAYKGSHLQR
jgi:Zn-dependent M28 family amino/carboxypeptidase